MTAFLSINSWDDIPAAIARFQAAGAGHRVPLLQALYHGQIAHLELHRASSARQFKQWAAASRLPALALLGDDDHEPQGGPDSWPVAARVMRWARFILIHGGAGRPEHYQYAVALAGVHKRVVMVECSSTNIPVWQGAAERWALGARGLTMKPPPGRPHPSLSRRAMS
ncbi:MAG: hypothetical protein ACRYHQ_12310 [Janthinobacterium lividum]